MAKLDRESLIAQDVVRAKGTLKEEGKKIDERKLQDDVHEDWEILSRARHLPEAAREKITAAVMRIIKTQRGTARKVLPPELMTKNPDFYRLMLAANDALSLNPDENTKVTPEDAAIIARTKRTIARDIIQPQLVHHVDQTVNAIIDSNDDKTLEEVIEQVIAHLKHECLGKNVNNICFYLVNEENYHGQVDELTRTSVGIPETRISRKAFDESKSHLGMFGKEEEPRTITDPKNSRIYFELKIKGQNLGVLEVEMKPGTKLSEIEKQYIRQAMSRLDSKIDEALHSKRLDIIARKAHRILDEKRRPEDFEAGIAEFMELVCLYSTAYEAEVTVDIFGDGEDWFAKKFNDDREITSVEMDGAMKAEVKIPAGDRRVDEKRALVLDIMDSTSLDEESKKDIIGKVIFRTSKDTDELTNEDHTLLKLCSQILSSHILKWRNDLKLRTEGVDPQIARNSMRAGNKDIIKETLTAFYTDIAGYTYICEILEDAFDGEETLEDIETLRAVLQEFLNLIQRTGQMYGGVWDKAVGDMGLMEFGVPIDQNDLDPLGNDGKTRRPEFFASNALKAALLVRKGLADVSRVFRDKLLGIAVTKYSQVYAELINEKPEEKEKIKASILAGLNPDEQTSLLQKLENETGLSPKITTTTSVYTGQGGYMKLALGAAHDWTGIGNTMNSAARVQGTSLKMEIRVPLLTRDLVVPHINMDTQIPFNRKGESESWSDFFRNRLGMDPAKVDVQFVEYYEGYKNKSGRNVVFTVNIKETMTDTIVQGSTLSVEQLLRYEGEEFGIVGAPRPIEGNMLSFKLRTITADPSKSVTFRVNIPQAVIDERVTRYKAPHALRRRAMEGATNSILVQNGKLKQFTWESIETDQNEELNNLRAALEKSKESTIVFTKMVPMGCYQLSDETPHGDRGHTVLSLRKDTNIFDVRVSNKKIHEGVGPIMKDDEVLHAFQAYYETIKGKTTPGKPIVFVRRRNFYKVTPQEAEAYLMPIITQTRVIKDGPVEQVKTSSSPPPAMNGSTMMPPAGSTYDMTGLGEKTPSRFWTRIAEQIDEYKWSGDELMKKNWNSHFPEKDESEAKK